MSAASTCSMQTGMLINSSAHWPAPDSQRRRSGLFQNLQVWTRGSPPVSIEPVHSRFTGAWTTVIARKMTGPNGEFLGAIGTRRSSPPTSKNSSHRWRLETVPRLQCSIATERCWRAIRMFEAMIGQNFKKPCPSTHILSKADHGTTRLISPIDGEDRLVSARALTGFPIVIIATTTVSAALADWREQIRFLIAVAGLSVLVIAGMLFFVVRKLSQQHRLSQQRLTLEKQRLDTAVNNIPQGLLLFDASAADYRLQPALHRDVRVVAGGGQAGLHHAGSDRASEGDRILRRRRRRILRAIMRNVALGKVTRSGHQTLLTADRSRSSTSRWRTADG